MEKSFVRSVLAGAGSLVLGAAILAAAAAYGTTQENQTELQSQRIKLDKVEVQIEALKAMQGDVAVVKSQVNDIKINLDRLVSQRMQEGSPQK